MRRAAALLLALTLFASCGGDDDTTVEEAVDEGATKAELIAQGDKICGDINAYSTANAPRTNEESVAFFETFIPETNSARDGFAGIDVLEGEDPDDVQTDMVFAMDAALDLIVEAQTAAVAGDYETMSAKLTQAGAASNASNPQAQAYGFRVCGQD